MTTWDYSLLVDPVARTKLPLLTVPRSKALCFGSVSESPECFFVQLVSNTEVIETMSTRLNDLYGTLGAEDFLPMNPTAGDLIAAKYDDGWFRAEVLEVTNSSSLNVLFIDYGNTDVVGETDTKVLDRRFFLTPPQAIRCCLANTSDLETKCDQFIAETQDQDLTVDVLGIANGIAKVNVKIKKNNIVYNIRNFLQLRGAASALRNETLSAATHSSQTTPISASATVQDFVLPSAASLPRSPATANVPIVTQSVTNRLTDRPLSTEGAARAEPPAVTPFDVSRIRKRLNKLRQSPSSEEEDIADAEPTAADLVASMRSHHLSSGVQLTWASGFRPVELNRPVGEATRFHTNQPVIEPTFRAIQSPPGFQPSTSTRAILNQPVSVESSPTAPAFSFPPIPPKRTSIPLVTASVGGISQAPITAGPTGYTVQSDKFAHLVHEDLPERVLELSQAWGKKNPVSILHEYGTVRKMDITFDLVSEAGPPGEVLFQYQAKVGGKEFGHRGVAHNKKDAKVKSAANALNQLIEEGYITNNNF